MTSSGYEFSNSQNELIEDLAQKMNFVAILLIVSGILGIIGALINLFALLAEPERIALVVSNLIQGVFLCLIGTWTKNAAQAFKQIVKTTGTDIENLMIALGELRKLYTLQYWLVVIVLVFSVLILVVGLIAGLIAAL